MIYNDEWNFSNPHHDAANICCISFNISLSFNEPLGKPLCISLRDAKAGNPSYPKLLTREVQDIIYAAGYNLTAKKQWYRFPNELCNFSGSKFRQWLMRNTPHYGTVITVTHASIKENSLRRLGDKAPSYIEG